MKTMTNEGSKAPYEEYALLPIKLCDEETTMGVALTYATVAGIPFPTPKMSILFNNIQKLVEEISDGHTWHVCDWGSSISEKSQLLMHQVEKDGEVYVGFEFKTNSENDDGPLATLMREKFYSELNAYIKKLTG